MRISIIVGGRFHAFNLAQQLNKHGCLSQLITSYPKNFVNKNYDINKDKIKSVLLKELFQRSFINKIFNIEDILIKYFSNKAKDLIDLNNTDILIGWSSFSLETFKLAKNKKCIKILERGSTHIDFQNQIVEEEYLINNLKPVLASKYVVEKELEEYEVADYIAVPTEFVRQTFISKGFSKEKIIKIPYGVNLKEFNSSKYRKKDDKFRIIYTGSVSVRKGLIYLLNSFDELNLKNTELLIIGNVENKMRKIIKKFESNKNIIFKNAVKQHELNKYYSYSDLFITCSIEEGLSMVQLQAMACGLPVICTRNSGGEEIIKDGVDGFILPIRDIEELKRKILYLYENKSVCYQMGKMAQKKLTMFFHGKYMVKMLFQHTKNY